MANSIEKPRKFNVVFGDMVYDEEKENIQCPPTTVNNRKEIPQKGRAIPEGEISIPLGYAKYEKDEKGKIVKVTYLQKEQEEAEMEM